MNIKSNHSATNGDSYVCYNIHIYIYITMGNDLWRRDRYRDIVVVPVDNFFIFDNSIHNGLLGQRVTGGLDKGRHEAKFDVVFLEEGVFVLGT